METNDVGQATQHLNAYQAGDKEALARLWPVIYQELRKIARGCMRSDAKGLTLQPTALVHEAFFRLIDQRSANYQNRTHFLAIAAQLMRRILIDYVRAKNAEKRGGLAVKVTLIADSMGTDAPSPDLIALDDALKELHNINARQAQIVEMRYFAGLSVEETAEALGISPATVKRDWLVARAWLHRELRT